jgi:WD40 repeat protein
VPLGWNPQRDALAVAAGPVSGKAPFGVQTTLRLISPDGSSRRLMRAPYVKSAAWSPSGDSLAVVSANGHEVQTLAVYPLSGGAPTVWLRYRPRDRLNGMTEIVIDVAGWWKGFGVGFWVFGDGMVHNNDATPLDVVAAPGTRPRYLASALSDGTTRVVAASARDRLAIVSDLGGGRVVWQDKHVEICEPRATCRPLAGSGSKVTLDPAWSPDGRTLALDVAPNLAFPGWPQKLMRRWFGAHRLVLYDTRTQRFHIVAGASGATVPAWSPDGKSLLYVSGDGLWLVPSLGSEPVEIASPLFAPNNWPAYYGQVAWSAQFDWWSKP